MAGPCACVSFLLIAVLYLTINTAPPGHNDAALYQIWSGIAYMWAPDGPIATGKFPRTDSESISEKAGAQLKQSHIQSKKTALSAKWGML